MGKAKRREIFDKGFGAVKKQASLRDVNIRILDNNELDESDPRVEFIEGLDDSDKWQALKNLIPVDLMALGQVAPLLVNVVIDEWGQFNSFIYAFDVPPIMKNLLQHQGKSKSMNSKLHEMINRALRLNENLVFECRDERMIINGRTTIRY